MEYFMCGDIFFIYYKAQFTSEILEKISLQRKTPVPPFKLKFDNRVENSEYGKKLHFAKIKCKYLQHMKKSDYCKTLQI